ncbi:MAG: serine/threonine-protein kinase [Gemmatimonadaceae bacterium]
MQAYDAISATPADSAAPPEAATAPSAEDKEFRERLERALGDDYRVGALIGQGGFGRVYAANDVRLHRAVAIKVIRPELAGARAFLDRFQKEGMALAKFRHPGIVPIYDIREHEGLIYYVMPHIEGETLRAKMDKRAKLAPKEVQRILVELCDCLAATHRAGIVHRDIKPDNVILEGMLGKALLMDFGIAKSMLDFGGTASGMIMGTPTYMSPEQATGDTEVDHRSDLYSVGVLGYHMLTGRPPFEGGAHALIASHVADAPQPIRRTNPSVPKALADLVEQCLAKAPEDRVQSASELGFALQQVVFASDVEPMEDAPPNYAMPFFAGVALECAVFAALGWEWLQFLGGDALWYMAGAAGLLAIVLSPVARAATEPLDGQLRATARRAMDGLMRRRREY